MNLSEARTIFNTKKRIRLGIWGLGRGMSFYRTCGLLNMDVVAGCDYNKHMRDRFLSLNPGAFATDDAERFLAADFDAVLLATYCPNHAEDAIACLKAGKHVISEVTSFHTIAEGVRLVEAVEKTGLVYNLAENYPFSAANMYLRRKWTEGVFGELMYAEFEYVHEVLSLSYTNIDDTPIAPGNRPHSWRSWLNFHYYNTHSLGPVMYITGLRPTRVVALTGKQRLQGYLMRDIHGMGGIAPSLINMSNGGVMRNLMGATTNDQHIQRLWGTQGSADIVEGKLRLRLGGSGSSPRLEVIPRWDELGELAAATGHGGGDFWVLYFFARQILQGVPAPFDVYTAADCTIPGILAYRSQVENGAPHDVPDFRDPAQRDRHRRDDYAQPRYDVKGGLFPPGADESLTRQFSVTMRDLIQTSRAYRAYRDWRRVIDDMKDPVQVLALADDLIKVAPRLQEVQKVARKIVDAYPESDGARVLRDMLMNSDQEVTSRPDFLKQLKRECSKLARVVARIQESRPSEERIKATQQWFSPFVTAWNVSKLMPKGEGIPKAPAVKLSDKRGWKKIQADPRDVGPGGAPNFINVNRLFAGADGIVYLGNRFKVAKRGIWNLSIGHDGGVRVFVDGKAVLCAPERVNPAVPDRSKVSLTLSKGNHEIVCALDTDNGLGWGIFFRFELPESRRPKPFTPQFPACIGGR